jgi:hypothetical protein
MSTKAYKALALSSERMMKSIPEAAAGLAGGPKVQ